MITSINNPRIKHLVELQTKSRTRNKENLFVVEGFKMFIEAPLNLIKEVYIDEALGFMKSNASTNNEAALAKIKECQKRDIIVEEVTKEVLKKAANTETPQGIIFVMQKLGYKIEDIIGKNILILEDIQDPGNLGTMIRTGEGAGISGILMTKGTVDIYNPKTVRSTMGSLYRVPFVYTDDLREAVDIIKNAGVKVYAAHLKGEHFYNDIQYGAQSAFLIGNEGNGLTDEAAALADEYIKIPMDGQLESLNAAVAAAILMYEARNKI